MKRFQILFCIILLSPSEAWLFAQQEKMGEPDLFGPRFQRYFAESYIPLKEREPDMSELELTLIQKIGPMVEEDPEFAKTMLEGMLEGGDPVSATFDYLLANLYFNGDSIENAETRYLQAIEKYPSYRRAWKNLAVLRLRDSRFEQALEALVKTIELGDTSADTYGMIGFCHLQVGDYLSSELAYNMAALQEPQNLDWLEGRVQALIDMEQFEKLLPLMEELIRRQPRNPKYRILMANAYIGMENPILAAQSIEVAHLLGGGSPGSLLQLANLYSAEGVFDLSVQNYIKVIETSEKLRPAPLLTAVKYLLENGEAVSARLLIDRLQIDQGDWSASDVSKFRLLQANLALSDGDAAEAESILKAALESDPLNGDLLVEMGMLYGERSDLARALFYFDEAIGIPGYEYKGLVLKSRILLEQSRYEESLSLLQRANSIQPSAYLDQLIGRVKDAVSRADLVSRS